MTSQTSIYADHAATTPVRAEVADAMAACRREAFGNPSSVHQWGQRARRRLEEARDKAAEALGVGANRVFFTRGGTESANIAVLGWVRRVMDDGEAPTVIVSEIEHPAVAGAAEQAEREGARRVVVGVARGELDVDGLVAAAEAGPALVSCMWVDNETGLVLPVEKAAEAGRQMGAVVHSDAVQAVGKMQLALGETPVDMATIAGHKVYGPKAAGLLVAPGPDFVRPLHYGGGQERGLRPGTEDVAAAAGLAEAVGLAVAEMPAEAVRLKALRSDVESRVRERVPGLRVAHADRVRAPHISSLAVPDADTDMLLSALDMAGVAASSGSACASGSSSKRSGAGVSDDAPREATLRLSFGKLTEERHAERLAEAVVEAAGLARGLDSGDSS